MTHQGSSRASFPETNSSPSDGAERPNHGKPATGFHRTAGDLPYSGELLRKMLHLLALVIPAGMYVLGKGWALSILLPATILAVGADMLRTRSERFAGFIDHVFGRMMRPGEVPSVGSRTVLNGATWVLISAALLALFFPIDLAAPAFASFMVADAAAAVAGIRLGRHRWTGTRRTVEGSAAFVLVAFLCLLPFDHISVGPAATAAIVGAAAEIPEWRVNDNIRVPIIMTAILFVWLL